MHTPHTTNMLAGAGAAAGAAAGAGAAAAAAAGPTAKLEGTTAATIRQQYWQIGRRQEGNEIWMKIYDA
uniref:Uncharacterized protein n=1 Tax=Syphacia muris TaxID=451379 RepID=A0A0N5AQA8_9BILA